VTLGCSKGMDLECHFSFPALRSGCDLAFFRSSRTTLGSVSSSVYTHSPSTVVLVNRFRPWLQPRPAEDILLDFAKCVLGLVGSWGLPQSCAVTTGSLIGIDSVLFLPLFFARYRALSATPKIIV
jgi:hypothetical protein